MILYLATLLVVFQTSEGVLDQLDDETFDAMKNAVYGALEERDHEFWKFMKEKITTQMLPEQISIPGIEGKLKGEWFCASETKVDLKLKHAVAGKESKEDIILSFPLIKKKKTRITAVFSFTLTKPLKFYAFGYGVESQMSYKLNSGKIMIIFEIPDFSGSSITTIKKDCLVTIKDVQVHIISSPKCINKDSESAKKLHKELFKSFIVKSYNKYLTAGIIRGLRERQDSWICTSEDIHKLYDESRPLWILSDDYMDRCLERGGTGKGIQGYNKPVAQEIHVHKEGIRQIRGNSKITVEVPVPID